MALLKTTSSKKPYIIKNDFLSKGTLDFVLSEIENHKGTYSREGYNNKKLIRDHKDPRFCETKYIRDQRSILFSIWSRNFWKELSKSFVDIQDCAFLHALHIQHGSVLLSNYANNDYYGQHIDIDLNCIITAVLMLSFPKANFIGGDFELEDETIKFENNKLIIFPSCLMHGVSKIDTKDSSYKNRRFSLQYFISSINVNKPIIDESSYK